jgi:hypothetical protein
MPKILSEAALSDYRDFDDVLKRYPVSRATIIRAVNDGRFPAPTKINGRVRWRMGPWSVAGSSKSSLLKTGWLRKQNVYERKPTDYRCAKSGKSFFRKPAKQRPPHI